MDKLQKQGAGRPKTAFSPRPKKCKKTPGLVPQEKQIGPIESFMGTY